MKKVLLGLIAGTFMMTACEDEFTEKDLLDAQQSVAYTVELVDLTAESFVDSANNLEGITVNLMQGGNTLTAVTNAEGFAQFPQVKLGTVNIRIENENFYQVKDSRTLEAGSRVGQLSSTINILPKNGKNVSTVEGVVEIETDLTNEEREFVPAGTVISFFFVEDENEHEPITTTVGADGKYSVKLPASRTGLTYEMHLPALNLDQKIAINAFKGEDKVNPRVETISTVFALYGGTVAVPSVNPIAFLLNGKVVGYGSVNGNGELSTYNYNHIIESEETYEASAELAVTVRDLTGSGSGAVVTAHTNADGYISYFSVEDGGKDYRSNANISAQSASGYSDFEVRSGAPVVKNIYFGTGSSRTKEIENK